MFALGLCLFVTGALGRTCYKVCNSDNCKGTRTNPLPRGEQWYTAHKWHTESGCCAWGGWQCDLCCDEPPTSSPTYDPKCDKVTISAIEATTQASSKLKSLNVRKFNYDQCRLGDLTQEITLTHSTTTETSSIYSTDRSLSNTWAGNVGGSVSVEASAGFSVPAIGDVDTKVTATVETSRSWGGESVSTSSTQVGKVTTTYTSMEIPITLSCPANKKCNYEFTETESTTELRWKATSHCMLKDGSEWKAPGKQITGTFEQARNQGYAQTHTIMDCPDLHTTQYCHCQYTWSYLGFYYKQCAQPHGSSFNWCYVKNNDPRCDYSNLKTDGGRYWDSCDPTVGGGSRSLPWWATPDGRSAVDVVATAANPVVIIAGSLAALASIVGLVVYCKKRAQVEQGYEMVV